MGKFTYYEVSVASGYVRWCDVRGLSWKAQLARDWLADSTAWGGDWNTLRGLRRFGTPSEFERAVERAVRERIGDAES